MNPPSAPTFDLAALHATLGELAGRLTIEHLPCCTSTNTLLAEQAALGAASGTVLVADEQTAGRGRRGRSWVSTAGYSLTFSLLWRFPGTTSLAGLSLAVGLATAQALEDLGCPGIGLKWPNDIWLMGRKLGGILVEASRAGAQHCAIIGIGINLRRHPQWAPHIQQAFAALDESALALSRETVLGTLLVRLSTVLAQFAATGFAPLAPHWNQRNALRGLPIRICAEHHELLGLCGAARADGALELIDDRGECLIINAGEVSLRLATPASS